MQPSQRKFIVVTSLAGILLLTSLVLVALAPAPLAPEAAGSLYAFDSANAMESIFRAATTEQRRWDYIYVHHSKSWSGNASTLGLPQGGLNDHFLIGNGEGTVDGEIQMSRRWTNQIPALPPYGASKIDDNCISICLVGDFDRSLPTQSQVQRLIQLVNALQDRYRIPADRVLFFAAGETPASAGKYFHSTAFREQLLP